LAVIIATVNFFFATWETYYTGTLFLGYINGPTEGLLISVMTLIISGVYGPQTWKQPISIVYKTGNPYVDSLSLGQASLWVMFFLMVFTQLPVSVYRALRACYHKGISRTTALLNTLPFLTMLASAFIWTYAPGSTVMPGNTILFLLAWGIATGKINALLVLRHVTHTEYPTYYRLVLPFVIGAICSVLPYYTQYKVFTPVAESYYIRAMFLYIAIDYLLWAIKVIEQFCDHLHIHCFSIHKVRKVQSDDIPLPDEHYLDVPPPNQETPKKTRKRIPATPVSEGPITRSRSKRAE
jgi:ethanolaminephosphotransferase